MKKRNGFTLIELMIAATVVGILTAIAYPSYREHVMTSRRGDAQGALLGFAGAMERHFTVNNTYRGAGQGDPPADTGAPGIFPAEAPLDGRTKFYDLEIRAATAGTYTLIATPKNAQTADKCGILTVTHTGVRGIETDRDGVTANDCWK